MPILNEGFQHQKHLVKKDVVIPGSVTIGIFNFTDASSIATTKGTTAWHCVKHTAWMASVPLNLANHPTHVVLDLGCTRSIGSRAAIRRFQKHALCCCITTKFCRCNKSFVFANSETESCWESCVIHFPTTPPCSTRVDVLETGNVPILFSSSNEQFGNDY